MGSSRSLWPLIMACGLFALATTGSAKVRKDSSVAHLRPTWSMEFQIDKDFEFKAFQGATISVTRHLRPDRAMRFGVSLSGSTEDSDNVERGWWDGYPGTSEVSLDSDTEDISVHLCFDYLLQWKQAAGTSFFAGAGPVVAFDRSTLAKCEDRTSSAGEFLGRERVEHLWQGQSVGVRWVAGVEWAVAKRISLIGQYSTALSYTWGRSERIRRWRTSTTETDYVEKEEGTHGGFSVRADDVKVGVSVHF